MPTIRSKEARTSNPFQDVVDFHKKFGIQYDGPPRQLPLELRAFRIARLREEFLEYNEAMIANYPNSTHPPTHHDQFDALIDLIYIALGTIHLHGWNFHEGWRRVHAANMAKERGSSGDGRSKPYAIGVTDIVKPDGWTAPTLADLVK